jgi:hypothetical protein
VISENLWKEGEKELFQKMLGGPEQRVQESYQQLLLAKDRSPATVHTDLSDLVVPRRTRGDTGLTTLSDSFVDPATGTATIAVDGVMPDGRAIQGAFTYGKDVFNVGQLIKKITALYDRKAVASLKEGRIVFTDTVAGNSQSSLRLMIAHRAGKMLFPFRVVKEGGMVGIIITSHDGYEGPTGDGTGPDFHDGTVFDIDGGNGDPLISIAHSQSEWLELYNCYNSAVPEHVRSFQMGTGTYGTCQISHELLGRVLFTDTVLTTGDLKPVTDLTADLNDLEVFGGGLSVETGTINITGTKPDGTEVSSVFTYDADGKTMGDLLEVINVAYEGHAVTTLEDGRIVIHDDETGLSQTSLALSSETGFTLPCFITEVNPTERVLLISSRKDRIEYHVGLLSNVQLEVVEILEVTGIDETAFTVTVGTETAVGSHDIDINRLATADTRVSQLYTATGSDFTSIATEQTFGISVAHPVDDDPDYIVEIPITEPPEIFALTNLEVLEAVANDINIAMDDAVITGEITADEKTIASVEATETGMNRLVVTSGLTGETNALQFNDPDGFLSGTELNASVQSTEMTGGYITAANELDAEIAVDGNSFTSGSNRIEGALEGASIQALSTSTGTTRIAVSTLTSTEKTFITMPKG